MWFPGWRFLFAFRWLLRRKPRLPRLAILGAGAVSTFATSNAPPYDSRVANQDERTAKTLLGEVLLPVCCPGLGGIAYLRSIFWGVQRFTRQSLNKELADRETPTLRGAREHAFAAPSSFLAEVDQLVSGDLRNID